MTKRLVSLFRSRLALRAVAIILLIVVVLGACFLALAVQVRAESEKEIQQDRLEGLISTVERTAQIACFLNDTQLAYEVTEGLLSNRIVHRASLVRNNDRLLAESTSGPDTPDTDNTQTLSRQIYSPFTPEESVCRLELVPDQAWIDSRVHMATRFLSGALLLQMLGIAASVVLVVFYFVARPITRLSHRLHGLKAEAGEKLEAPVGNRHDEIGRLVAGVNAMIDRLVNSLGEERRLRLEREVEERRYRAIFDNVEAGIFELDDRGRVIAANPAFCRLFMLSERFDPAQDALILDELTQGMEIADSRREGARQWEISLGEGQYKRWVSLLVSPLEAGRLQGVAHDITDRKLAADAAEKLAVTDALTGLGNRLGLERRLALIERHHRLYPDRHHALLMLDFDRFKLINDSHGHHAGDEVLKHIADVLGELTRRRDFLARPGGDEFVLLLEDRTEHAHIEALARRLIERVNRPFSIGSGVEVTLGVSIGVAVLGVDTRSTDELMKMADHAMYQAKHSGRNTWRFYRSDAAGI